MTDVSKTNELIEKLALAAEDAAGGPPSAEQVDALIDYSDALREALERSQRGGATLGEIIKQQCEDIVKITRSEDLILPDGDGDYETVWERAFKMRADLDALEAATRERDAAVAVIERVRALHPKHEVLICGAMAEVPHRHGSEREPYPIRPVTCTKLQGHEGSHRDASCCWNFQEFDNVAAYKSEEWADRSICSHCQTAWPCPTVEALDGAPEPEVEAEEEMYQAGCGSWDCRAPECGRA